MPGAAAGPRKAGACSTHRAPAGPGPFPPEETTVVKALACERPITLESVGHLFDMLGRDADGPIKRDARAGQDRGEQVALIAFGVRQEASRVDRAAAFAGDDKGEVFAGV